MLKSTPASNRSRRRFAGTAALSGAAVVVLLVAVLAWATPDSPGLPSLAAGQAEMHDHSGRPAHLSEGDCVDLGEVKHALNPVGAGEMAGPDMADQPAMAVGDRVGSEAATAIETGAITLAVPIDEIVTDGLALVVHRGETEYGVVVACGEVGGAMTADGVAFGLREQADSGLSGVAVLTPAGGETRVTLYLGPALSGGAEASPAADANLPLSYTAFG